MTEPNEKPSLFNRAKQAVKDAYAEDKAKRAAAAEEEAAFYAEATAKHGRLVKSALFSGHRIELYDGGYVRVGGYRNTSGGPLRDFDSSDYVVAYDAPFEKLRAIKASTQVQDKSAGGRAVASAASLGLSKMASNEKRFLFLTISTDQETYSFKEKGGMLRILDQIPMELEIAGQGILDALAGAGPSASAPTSAAPGSVADQLRDLAALHGEGILTDDEFTAAKAKLLGT